MSDAAPAAVSVQVDLAVGADVIRVSVSVTDPASEVVGSTTTFHVRPCSPRNRLAAVLSAAFAQAAQRAMAEGRAAPDDATLLEFAPVDLLGEFARLVRLGAAAALQWRGGDAGDPRASGVGGGPAGAGPG